MERHPKGENEHADGGRYAGSRYDETIRQPGQPLTNEPLAHSLDMECIHRKFAHSEMIYRLATNILMVCQRQAERIQIIELARYG
jgi:hypothetical protein